jgi:hypothetical protein
MNVLPATFHTCHKTKQDQKNNHRGLSPRANYTYRATAALSAKLVQTFADRSCHMVSATDSYGRMLGFLDRTSKKYKFSHYIVQENGVITSSFMSVLLTDGRISSVLKYRSIVTFCTALKLASNVLMGILPILTTKSFTL